jgi:Lar family restriction alleviation protein
MTNTPEVSDELLPCPFCGHVGLDFDDENGSTFRWAKAECSGCGASTGEVRKHEDWKQDAIEAWNRRSVAGVSDEQLDRMAFAYWRESLYSGRDGQDFDHHGFARALLALAPAGGGMLDKSIGNATRLDTASAGGVETVDGGKPE